jgi:hypothetical protein
MSDEKEYPEAGPLRHLDTLTKFSMIIYAVLLSRLGVKHVRVYDCRLNKD